MSDGECCACLHVEYMRQGNFSSGFFDGWRCRDCGSPFLKRTAAEFEMSSLRRELEAVRGERDRMKALLDDAQACGLIHHTACAVAFGKTCDCGVGELDHQIQDALLTTHDGKGETE